MRGTRVKRRGKDKDWKRCVKRADLTTRERWREGLYGFPQPCFTPYNVNEMLVYLFAFTSFRDLRSLVVEMVLATDMSCHFEQIKVMKSLLQQPEA